MELNFRGKTRESQPPAPTLNVSEVALRRGRERRAAGRHMDATDPRAHHPMSTKLGSLKARVENTCNGSEMLKSEMLKSEMLKSEMLKSEMLKSEMLKSEMLKSEMFTNSTDTPPAFLGP